MKAQNMFVAISKLEKNNKQFGQWSHQEEYYQRRKKWCRETNVVMATLVSCKSSIVIQNVQY